MKDDYLESSNVPCEHYCKAKVKAEKKMSLKAFSVPNLLHVELHTETDKYKLLLGSSFTHKFNIQCSW